MWVARSFELLLVKRALLDARNTLRQLLRCAQLAVPPNVQCITIRISKLPRPKAQLRLGSNGLELDGPVPDRYNPSAHNVNIWLQKGE